MLELEGGYKTEEEYKKNLFLQRLQKEIRKAVLV